MWAKNGNIAEKEITWIDAMFWVKNLNYTGYTDWRLPTKEELEALSKHGGTNPSKWFNANGFNNVQASWYWSSSTYAYVTFYAWGVYMVNGNMYVGNKGNIYYVWPVRSVQ